MVEDSPGINIYYFRKYGRNRNMAETIIYKHGKIIYGIATFGNSVNILQKQELDVL